MLSAMTDPAPDTRTAVDGKFLATGGDRFLVKGVAYGTFAPDAAGRQFPAAAAVADDFARMREAGLNTVRTYTAPDPGLLDAAARHGLRVMVGLPWPQHLAFLDDPDLCRRIRGDIIARVRGLSDHPAALVFALGNEIPAPIVRWHGQARVERFLRELYHDVKAAAPQALLTYVNYPPTEYLSLPFLDVCAFNVYLHAEAALRRSLARLQHLAGHRPLLLAEAGADSRGEGGDGQAAIAAMHVRTAFSEGACGAVVFAWTDEWWRGGRPVDDWAFGLVDAARKPKPALGAVARAFADAPFPEAERRTWPKISVVVCAYNEAATIDECLTSIENLSYPDYEIILVNDGSRDATGDIARRHASVELLDIPNGGLSAARNVGLEHATGEIVAYTDGDVRVDPDWLTHLVRPFLTSDVVGAGGPNLVPADDPPMAQCIARAPGSPTQVMLDDRIAEHVPGCNMAFRRDALLEVGGFNPIYLRAGDDVDICWRLQARGWKIGFAPSALVWHRHRASLRAYWRQQVGYGEGESWLKPHHPDQFQGLHIGWRGRIYGPLPFHRSLTRARVNSGTWGTAPFPSVYSIDTYPFAFMPHSARWQVAAAALIGLGAATLLTSQIGLALALLAVGTGALGTTVARCVRYARVTDIEGLPPLVRRPRRLSRILYRSRIAGLYFVQPLARAWGRLRGAMSPPEVVRAPAAGRRPPVATAGAIRALRAALSRGTPPRRYWSETWITAETLLSHLTARLERTREVRTVEIDDGWQADRDISVGLNRWARLHLRVLVEEHREGRCLVRLARRLEATPKLWLAGACVAGGALVATAAGPASYGPWLAGAAALLAVWAARTLRQSARAVAAVDAAVADTAGALGLMPLPDAPAREEARESRPTASETVVAPAP
ncbi:MAG: glycosyltransferase, partial [Acidobacteria bacterium]|nr:glycosyltransferase [Acidobacteriota bacterium]